MNKEISLTGAQVIYSLLAVLAGIEIGIWQMILWAGR